MSRARGHLAVVDDYFVDAEEERAKPLRRVHVAPSVRDADETHALAMHVVAPPVQSRRRAKVRAKVIFTTPAKVVERAEAAAVADMFDDRDVARPASVARELAIAERSSRRVIAALTAWLKGER